MNMKKKKKEEKSIKTLKSLGLINNKKENQKIYNRV